MSGSWNLDKAVQARWIEKNLDAKFRALWRTPSETKWPVLHSGEARPGAQMPFCCYEKGVPVKQGESTSVPGEAGLQIEYWMVPISFRIHARAISGSPARSAKDVAQAMAQEVVAAYEDDAGVLDLEDDDCHLETVVGPDFDQREDDDVHLWVCQFEVYIERRRAMRGV